jgi:hypothetical protein
MVIAPQQHLKITSRGRPNYLSRPASRGSTDTMMLLNQAESVLPRAASATLRLFTPPECSGGIDSLAKLSLSLLAYTEVGRDVNALALSAFLLSRR